MRVYDDRRRALDFAAPPRRVVSLVPSDTLSVAALGCADALVGRTDYCDLPVGIGERVPSVGGTKNPRVAQVLALAPDLVLANQEENTRGDLETLARAGVRIYVAFPKRVADGLAHLAKLALILGVARDIGTRALLERSYEAYRAAGSARARQRPVRVFCPIWMRPLMTIRGDTFMSNMLDVCGAANVFADRTRRYPLMADLGRATPVPAEQLGARDVRYPRITVDEVVARAPEAIVLPDEPYSFTVADAEAFRALRTPAADRGAITFSSGKDLSWYGARSAEGIGRVRALVDGLRSQNTL
ncbi:MAG TPA: helical backbone metal receptor [Polyangiaceae bacterium]|nr:helical backbone metal receptor [Polyangiaceae bacterium]